MLRTTLSLSILLFAICGSTIAQGETILNFSSGFASGQAIPQDYGDNVTGPVTNGYNYGGSGIFTPDVTVAYSADGGNCSNGNPGNDQLHFHGGPFMDLFGCARSITFCDGWEITLTGGSGFLVQLHGFDLGRFTGFGGSFATLNVPEITVFDDSTQSVLFTQSNVALSCSTGCVHTSFDFSPPLSGVTLRIRVSTLGLGSSGDQFGMDNIHFSQGITGVPAQANSAAASLQINGVGPLGAGGPFQVSVAGSSVAFDWAGPPLQPYFLLAGPLDPIGFNAGAIGTVHVGTPSLAFSDVLIIFDGTSPVFPNPWFQLDAAGQSQQSFSLPTGVPGSVNLQGLVVQTPGSASPFLLTTAFQLSW